jgi:phosphate transport system substrate-binding protein
MFIRKVLKAGCVALLSALVVSPLHAEMMVDAKIADYQKVSGVEGTINSIGSDTLNNLMTLWAEAFRKEYSNVKIQIEGKGSSTAPPALIEGIAQLGPMSRKMKTQEIEKFEDKYGFPPTAIGVALDSLAVFVHRDNPTLSLSLQEVDGMFSKTQKGGLTNIVNWNSIGWANSPISLYGRNSASGTYGYFKDHALFKGDFKDTVKEQPGSASVVMGISEDLYGIGYSGIGYKTSSVKALALSKKKGEPAFEPNYANVLAGTYPLGRMLYVYVAKKPNQPMDLTTKEFLKLVLSKRGQEVVIKDGYLPLTPAVVEKQLALLD